MDVRFLFVAQFAWFGLVWTVLALNVVHPWLRTAPRRTALLVWVTPQAFRVLGVGLLVPSLSPKMPLSFAVPTAIGDSVTAALALLTVWGLTRNWRHADRLAWVVTIVGALDLVVALTQAARHEVARYLHGQWYVPALIVPLMLVAHAMALHTLLRRGPPTASPGGT